MRRQELADLKQNKGKGKKMVLTTHYLNKNQLDKEESKATSNLES